MLSDMISDILNAVILLLCAAMLIVRMDLCCAGQVKTHSLAHAGVIVK
jgi:hypothetical protein